jgi:hypothetical protein
MPRLFLSLDINTNEIIIVTSQIVSPQPLLSRRQLRTPKTGYFYFGLTCLFMPLAISRYLIYSFPAEGRGARDIIPASLPGENL